MRPPPFLAFFPRPAADTAPLQREWIEASDWAVLCTLGTLFFLLGSFATWAWLIWRRSTRPQPHVALLMEMEDEAEAAKHGEERTTPRNEKAEPTAPWEQPADWWKKNDGGPTA